MRTTLAERQEASRLGEEAARQRAHEYAVAVQNSKEQFMENVRNASDLETLRDLVHTLARIALNPDVRVEDNLY